MEGAFNDSSATLSPEPSPKTFSAALDVLLAPYGWRGAYGRETRVHRNLSEEYRGLSNMASTFPSSSSSAAFR
jgi:hypothetical protein